jgi:hypothetical protein
MQTCQLKSLQNVKKSVDKFTKSNYIIIKVCKTQTRKKGGTILFRNLEAEQARKGLTNSDVAEKLGISRVSYEGKKKTGKFTTFEIKALCKLFKCKFDYLFETD